MAAYKRENPRTLKFRALPFQKYFCFRVSTHLPCEFAFGLEIILSVKLNQPNPTKPESNIETNIKCYKMAKGKSAKGAEKKRERIAMMKKMDARIAIVKTANAQEDPLASLPSFKVCLSRNGSVSRDSKAFRSSYRNTAKETSHLSSPPSASRTWTKTPRSGSSASWRET